MFFPGRLWVSTKGERPAWANQNAKGWQRAGVHPCLWYCQPFAFIVCKVFLRIAGFLQRFRHVAQLLIPGLAEATDEGLLEKLVDRQVELAAPLASLAADVPLVVVEGHGAIGETLLADGVKGATDGLAELGAAGAIGFLQGTEADGLLALDTSRKTFVTGEHTVFAVDDAGHEVALLVGVGHALAVDDGLGRGTQVAPDGVEGVFDVCHFVEADGRAGIALDAAGATAGIKVATELFGQDVGRDEYVANL